MTRRPLKKTESSNIRSLVNLLCQFSPFDQVEQEVLFYLVESAEISFYQKGEVILSPEDGVVDRFFVIKQGTISGCRTLTKGVEETASFSIDTGACFPLAALLGERPTRTIHKAETDTFCLEIPKAAFDQAFQRSDSFREYCLRGVSMLLDRVHQDMQQQAAATLGQNPLLSNTLKDMVTRTAIQCSPNTPIQKAVKIMHAHNVSSIVVCEPQDTIVGIFTLRDLRRLIGECETDLTLPVSHVMTASPYTLDIHQPSFDAALLMARHHFGHVVVTHHGALAGVISERDLFALQRVDLVHLARAIAHAENVDALANIRQQIDRLIDGMLAHGAAVNQITRLLTQLNDITVSRCIDLCIGKDTYPAFSWVAFGSEARKEQTLHTDQDNGILFLDEHATEATRRSLLPLAKRINDALDRCGFTRCPGNIMASNPDLCLSQHEWQNRFAKIIDHATPQKLLEGSIYFDIRVVWGNESALPAIQQDIFQRVKKDSLFQHHLAANALERKPPLGVIRGFSYSGKGGEKHTIDLKTQGLTPFVAGARLLALCHGITSTNTVERLQALSDTGAIDQADANAWIESYEFIQLLRMRLHQTQGKQEKPLGNRLDPDRLNQMERNVLKEAFRQAQRFQRMLSIRYQV